MNYIRLNIIAEGQTEERFANKTLRKHLAEFNVAINARCVETSRDQNRIYRGGMISFCKAKNDIICWMKEDNNDDCRFTTMFDLYALPEDFPGFSEAQKKSCPYEKIEILEVALKNDLNDPRFIPYIQLHEFEALLLANPEKLSMEYLDREDSINRLCEMIKGKEPELINEGKDTAPSKRIIKEIPNYKRDKAVVGPLIAGEIGLNLLREKCKHFGEWLKRLEQLCDPTKSDC